VLEGVIVVRRADRFAANPTDGTAVYDGTAGFVEDVGLNPGTYYYTAFGYDAAGTNTPPAPLAVTITAALGTPGWIRYR